MNLIQEKQFWWDEWHRLQKETNHAHDKWYETAQQLGKECTHPDEAWEDHWTYSQCKICGYNDL